MSSSVNSTSRRPVWISIRMAIWLAIPAAVLVVNPSSAVAAKNVSRSAAIGLPFASRSTAGILRSSR